VLTLKIRRIESELGMKLLERAERGHPMAVTAEGQRVIDAITQHSNLTEPVDLNEAPLHGIY
jgi:DNA-binding transcriptional LysR family regulator